MQAWDRRTFLSVGALLDGGNKIAGLVCLEEWSLCPILLIASSLKAVTRAGSQADALGAIGCCGILHRGALDVY